MLALSPRRASLLAYAVGAAGLSAGCIIGTWPTPEEQPDAVAQVPNTGATGAETCDQLDNDGDGVVDEGCECSPGAERGCVGREGGQCGFGVQRCDQKRWSGCENIGPPWSTPQTPSVTIQSAPETLVRGSTEAASVGVTVMASCFGVVVSDVSVRLESSLPVMTVRAKATASGGADFNASLPNAFGPGVGTQTLTLTAEAVIDGQTVGSTAAVALTEATP